MEGSDSLECARNSAEGHVIEENAVKEGSL